jgi:3',5'-nucleoside bisphosphate phosphatase
MLRVFRCDLHVHTCLSPCAELDMYPRMLVDKCVAAKLDLIAITDHNASENVAHVLKASAGLPIKVLPGMEVSSREEVHLLSIFDRLEDLETLQTLVYDHLPGKNDESIFGCQPIVNEEDDVEGMNERLLIGATQLPLERLIAAIHDLGGLAIASHIDRESYSVISQLGFIAPDAPFDALEISHALGLRQARRDYPNLSSFAFIESSDAHFTRDIGRGFTEIMLGEGAVSELKMAFKKVGGRCIQE